MRTSPLVLPASSYVVPESRVFTYPTRLADTYAPDCLEIVKPSFTVTLPGSEISVAQMRSSALPWFAKATAKRRLFMKHARVLRVTDACLLDLRYEADGNISHLITFAAPLALLARDRLGCKVRIVLKKKTTPMSKRVFGALGFETLSTDHDVEAEFVLGSDGHDRVYESQYASLFGPLGDEFGGGPSAPGERLFISRRDRRKLVNGDEIGAILEGLGFRTVYFEDHPMTEQWRMAANAEAIVAIHGAALGSLVFNRRRVKLVELFHPGFSVDFFRRVAHLAGGEWCGVFGRMPADLVRRLDERSDTAAYWFEAAEIHETSLALALGRLGIAAP